MKLIITENQLHTIKEFENDNIFYRGLQSNGSKTIALETWTKSYDVAKKYALLNGSHGQIVYANLSLNKPLSLNNENTGSQINLEYLSQYINSDDLRNILKNVIVKDYSQSEDGDEIRGLPDNSDLNYFEIVLFDLIDDKNFSGVLKKNGYDSIIYYGWEGEGINALEYRVLDNSQIVILKVEKI